MKKWFVITLLALSTGRLQAADYLITDFGARAEAGYLNTESLQKAIDRCSAEGGGRVVVPRGEFMIGTVDLKDGVILYLDPGAKLVGSTERRDYDKNLIRAVGARRIGIDGYGTIDGSGWAFWYVKENGHYDHARPVPGYMVYLEDCTDVTIRDVRLQNAESWTLHLLGCSKVSVRGITIRNPLHGPNNDGIDIQASRDVIISDCDIYTSDDAIVLKNRHPKYYDRPCSNIAVTNCILTCVCNAFKIGTETIGSFGNIVFSNSTIRAALPSDSLARIRYEEVDMPLRAISGISIESVDGSIVDGVSVSNIVMEEVRVPIFIRLANRGAGVQRRKPAVAGRIRNIQISNITARHAWYASSITAIPGSYVEDVMLNNIRVTMAGNGDARLAEKEVDEMVTAYPDAHMWRKLPASAFYVRHVDGLVMDRVRSTLDGPDQRPVAIFDDVKNLSVRGFSTDAHPVGASVIRCQGVENGRFADLDLSKRSASALELRGTNRSIRVSDMPEARISAAQGLEKTTLQGSCEFNTK